MFKEGDCVIVKCAFCSGCKSFDCSEVVARVDSVVNESIYHLKFLIDNSYCNVKNEYIRRPTDRERFLYLTYGMCKFGE